MPHSRRRHRESAKPAIAQCHAEKPHRPASHRSGSRSGSTKHGRSNNRRSPASPRRRRTSRIYPSKQANGRDCKASEKPPMCVSGSDSKTLCWLLRKWKIGILECRNIGSYTLTPLFQYSIILPFQNSITPFFISTASVPTASPQPPTTPAPDAPVRGPMPAANHAVARPARRRRQGFAPPPRNRLLAKCRFRAL